MKILLLIDSFVYHGKEIKKGEYVVVDKETGLRLLKLGFATYMPPVVNEAIKEKTRKAVRISTNKNA